MSMAVGYFNPLYTNDHNSGLEAVSEFLQNYKFNSALMHEIKGIIPHWIYLLLILKAML